MTDREQTFDEPHEGWDCGDCPYKKPWAHVAAENERLRTALETIKRTTKSGGAEAIARKALDA